MRVTPTKENDNIIISSRRGSFDERINKYLDPTKYDLTDDEIIYFSHFIQNHPALINSIPYEINAKMNNTIFSINKIPKIVFIITNIYYNTIKRYHIEETTNPTHFYLLVKLTTYVVIIEKYFRFLEIQDNVENEKKRIVDLIDDSIELTIMNCTFPIIQKRKWSWYWCI
jgi:hypothetical protein